MRLLKSYHLRLIKTLRNAMSGDLSLARIAKLSARSQTLIGAIAAIVVLAPLPISTTVMADDPPQVNPFEMVTPSVDDGENYETQAYVSQQIFSDYLNPASLGFRFSEFVDGPGTYDGTDAYDREVSFQVVQSINIPLYESYPDYFSENDAASVCIGWLQGTSGVIPISAMCLKIESFSGDSADSFVVATLVLSDKAVLTCAKSETLLNGNYVNDLTLLQCLTKANTDFGFRQSQNNANLVFCGGAAALAFLLALEYCAFNPANAVNCVRKAVVVLAIAIAVCTMKFIHDTATNMSQWTRDVAACLLYQPPPPTPIVTPSGPIYIPQQQY